MFEKAFNNNKKSNKINVLDHKCLAPETVATASIEDQSEKRAHGSESGMSLLELMVVIVIMGLLTTVVVINVLPSQDRAMVEKAKADIKTIEQALQMYRLDNRQFPSITDGLDALVTPPDSLNAGERYRDGGYIQRLPTDPWGNDYQYIIPGELGAFDIYSFGADGRVGGEGMDADIGNWD